MRCLPEAVTFGAIIGHVQVRYIVAIVPLLCAGGWTLWTGPSHAADPASAAVWAASIAGFVYLARAALSSNPNLAEQIDDAAARLKDQLASTEALKKPILTFASTGQDVVASVKEVQEGTRVLMSQLKAMKEEARDAVAPIIADRDRALKAESDAVTGLMQAYRTLWSLRGQGEASVFVEQAATEFEREHLPRVGLSIINEVGAAVDYRIHQVDGADEPSADVPPGAVLRIVRPGFRRRGEVVGRADVVRACVPDVLIASDPSASASVSAPGVPAVEPIGEPAVPELPAAPLALAPATANSADAGDDA